MACGVLFGAITQRFNIIVESSAFEDFISFEKKGENKIRRIGKREKMKIQQL